MKPKKLPGYWPTRVLLVAGILWTAVVILVARPVIFPMPCFGCGSNRYVLGLPGDVLVGALGVVLAVFGLVWMLRIFRGPGDDPPPWRYRDR
jgi:hypothetical protein